MSEPSDRGTWPTGRTRVAGLIGYPARYSLSPALHGAAYRALGVDIAYVVFPVTPQHVGSSVEAVRALELVGVSVTLPHKEAVIPFLDQVSPEASRLRAVNCISREGKRLLGYNTDGSGFVRSLREESQFEPTGCRAIVIGAGGAARSVIGALADEEADEIVIVNRSLERAQQAVNLAPHVARVGSASDIEHADIVINATPVGMEGSRAGELPISIDGVHEKQLVVDLIYHPSETAFLQQCSQRGARTTNGLGMLVYQAAAQVELWTGMRPPIDVMRAAVAL